MAGVSRTGGVRGDFCAAGAFNAAIQPPLRDFDGDSKQEIFPLVDMLLVLVLAAHLLATNLAGAAPLVCIWLDVARFVTATPWPAIWAGTSSGNRSSG